MITGARTAPCPNCSAPISFGLASSPAKVCEYCSFVVIRSDQGFQSAGKMADLVPTASPFEVNDTIAVEGRNATVAGRSQRDWGMGPWDEFYISFDDGSTAWLAGAQGSWYVMSLVDPTGTSLSTWQDAAVGLRNIRLGADPRPWMVNEKRTSTLVAAKGEFDAALTVGEVSHYLDLSADGYGFATADFGNLNEPPCLYIGKVLAGNAVALVASAVGPRPEQRVDLARLQCPHCGAPVPIFAPSDTQRAICGSCGATMNIRAGNLQLLGALERRNVAMPAIPLGTKGTLRGTEFVVIGYMRRYTVVEGERYFWGEYLLHSSAGYAWLVEDNSAFMLTRTIQNSDVTPAGGWISGVAYQGKNFREYFANQAFVDMVVGEFYWRVEVGEVSYVRDYIAPPRVISVEQNNDEIITSLSEHVPLAEVNTAFNAKVELSDGVPVASPNPYKLLIPALFLVAGMVVLFIVAAIQGNRMPDTPVLTGVPLAIDRKEGGFNPSFGTLGWIPGGGTGPSDPTRATVYTDPFTVRRGPTTLAVTLNSPAVNVWVGADCALINEDNGEVTEFNVDVGRYQGFTQGENWSEGANDNTEYLTQVHSGHYSIRCATEWEVVTESGASPATMVPPTATLDVVANKRDIGTGLLAFLALVLPFGLGVYLKSRYETRRWENSNL